MLTVLTVDQNHFGKDCDNLIHVYELLGIFCIYGICICMVVMLLILLVFSEILRDSENRVESNIITLHWRRGYWILTWQE